MDLRSLDGLCFLFVLGCYVCGLSVMFVLSLVDFNKRRFV